MSFKDIPKYIRANREKDPKYFNPSSSRLILLAFIATVIFFPVLIYIVFPDASFNPLEIFRIGFSKDVVEMFLWVFGSFGFIFLLAIIGGAVIKQQALKQIIEEKKQERMSRNLWEDIENRDSTN